MTISKMEAKEIETLIESLERHLEVSRQYLSKTYDPHSHINGASLLRSYDMPLLEGFIEGLRRKINEETRE